MIAQKLYMAVWVDSGVDHEECYHEDATCSCFDTEPNPDGWEEYAVANGIVDETGAAHDFFWPKTNVPYKSRSSAQYRVNAINRWGGNAVVVECDPIWVPIAEANARREIARIDARIAKREAVIVDLYRKRDAAGAVA